MARKLIYYVACTADGFIARADGSFDCFLMDGEHFVDIFASFPETIPAHLRGALGITADNQRFGVVLMGRKTYEVGAALGLTNPYPQMTQYVFSHSMKDVPDEAVRLVAGDAVAKVRELKQEAGKDIWLCGGAELAAQLFPEIDEMILKVNPVVIGAGIPLYGGEVKATAVELIENKVYKNGFVLNRYRVRH